MPSLSERLKSLGVKVGARDLPQPPPPKFESVQTTLSLEPTIFSMGTSYIREQLIRIDDPAEYHDLNSYLSTLASWAGQPSIARLKANAFAFLDTETTGLSGGSGTIPFLIGIGRFEGDQFHLAQFFLRNPAEEPAHLQAIEHFLAPCEALVTFNGKAFDIPIINARFQLQRWRSPLAELASIDLLHLARRLWRQRLPSRTLGNLEVEILRSSRTEEDVPGWAIPQMYADYLLTGDAQLLKSVFYHNAMDVISMAELFNHLAGLLSTPLEAHIDHSIDLVALARLFEDIGDFDTAIQLYSNVLGLAEADQNQQDADEALPKPVLLDAINRLAHIHKLRDNLTAAIPLLEKAASLQHVHAHIELAKIYEHRMKNYQEAIQWTITAIDIVNSTHFPLIERQQMLSELEHRLRRLQVKLNSHGYRDKEVPKA